MKRFSSTEVDSVGNKSILLALYNLVDVGVKLLGSSYPSFVDRSGCKSTS